MLDEIQPFIGQSLAETMTSSWVAGAAANAVHLPKPKQKPFQPLPDDRAASGFKPTIVKFPGFDKALRELHAKEVLPPEQFYEVARSARAQAFTITADITDKTREKIHSILSSEVAQTGDYSNFVKTVRAELEELPISDRHLQQVYRNTSNSMAASGQNYILSNTIVGDGFPLVQFEAIHDERTRHDHRHLEHCGIERTNLYLRNSDAGKAIQTPLSWNCRCSNIPCSIERAARRGLKFAQEWLAAIRKAEKDGTFSGTQADYMPEPPNVPVPEFDQPPGWVAAPTV